MQHKTILLALELHDNMKQLQYMLASFMVAQASRYTHRQSLIVYQVYAYQQWQQRMEGIEMAVYAFELLEQLMYAENKHAPGNVLQGRCQTSYPLQSNEPLGQLITIEKAYSEYHSAITKCFQLIQANNEMHTELLVIYNNLQTVLTGLYTPVHRMVCMQQRVCGGNTSVTTAKRLCECSLLTSQRIHSILMPLVDTVISPALWTLRSGVHHDQGKGVRQFRTLDANISKPQLYIQFKHSILFDLCLIHSTPFGGPQQLTSVWDRNALAEAYQFVGRLLIEPKERPLFKVFGDRLIRQAWMDFCLLKRYLEVSMNHRSLGLLFLEARETFKRFHDCIYHSLMISTDENDQFCQEWHWRVERLHIEIKALQSHHNALSHYVNNIDSLSSLHDDMMRVGELTCSSLILNGYLQQRCLTGITTSIRAGKSLMEYLRLFTISQYSYPLNAHKTWIWSHAFWLVHVESRVSWDCLTAVKDRNTEIMLEFLSYQKAAQNARSTLITNLVCQCHESFANKLVLAISEEYSFQHAKLGVMHPFRKYDNTSPRSELLDQAINNSLYGARIGKDSMTLLDDLFSMWHHTHSNYHCDMMKLSLLSFLFACEEYTPIVMKPLVTKEDNNIRHKWTPLDIVNDIDQLLNMSLKLPYKIACKKHTNIPLGIHSLIFCDSYSQGTDDTDKQSESDDDINDHACRLQHMYDVDIGCQHIREFFFESIVNITNYETNHGKVWECGVFWLTSVYEVLFLARVSMTKTCLFHRKDFDSWSAEEIIEMYGPLIDRILPAVRICVPIMKEWLADPDPKEIRTIASDTQALLDSLENDRKLIEELMYELTNNIVELS